MAQTAAQKKALAQAQALIAKQKASLKKLEKEQKTMTSAQKEVDKQMTDDAYYTKKDSQGKTQAQRDALKDAFATAATIRKTSKTKTARVDPVTGKVITGPKGAGLSGAGAAAVDDNGGIDDETTTYTAPDGKIFTNLDEYNAYIEQTSLDIKKRAGQSAYDLLFAEFNKYGMGALVEPLKEFIQQGLSKSEFTIRLRETEAYKKRFAANAQRIAKGLAALDEAEYIGLEDQYQNIMRNYGLPASYYTRGDMGRQEGFEKFLANDVSASELEDRVLTAQSRVLNANPEVLAALKSFYPDITNGDILAYTLDPTKALTDIRRKVTAAEIGGAATQAGLMTGMARAEELGAAGITKAQAQAGFQTVAEVAPRGGQLAAMYGESPYTQQTAEQEVFGLAGSVEAGKQRKKLVELEQASFAKKTGAAQGALGRERAGNL